MRISVHGSRPSRATCGETLREIGLTYTGPQSHRTRTTSATTAHLTPSICTVSRHTPHADLYPTHLVSVNVITSELCSNAVSVIHPRATCLDDSLAVLYVCPGCCKLRQYIRSLTVPELDVPWWAWTMDAYSTDWIVDALMVEKWRREAVAHLAFLPFPFSNLPSPTPIVSNDDEDIYHERSGGEGRIALAAIATALTHAM